MEFNLFDNVSADEFDKRIAEQDSKVTRLQAELDRELRRLNWLKEGRQLYAPAQTTAAVAARERSRNGRPASLTEAIIRVMAGQGDMLTGEIIAALLRREWISEEDRHTASSMLSNMTARGQLERVDRGVYKLPSSDDARAGP